MSESQEKISLDERTEGLWDRMIEKLYNVICKKKVWISFLIYFVTFEVFCNFIRDFPLTVKIIIAIPLIALLLILIIFAAHIFSIPFLLFEEGDRIMAERHKRRQQFLDWVRDTESAEIFKECCLQLDSEDNTDPLKSLVERFLAQEKKS